MKNSTNTREQFLMDFEALMRQIEDIERMEELAGASTGTGNVKIDKFEKLFCRLAYGIVHDLNNMMGAITGYTQLLGKHSADPARRDDIVKKINIASLKAADLASQLLTLAKAAGKDTEYWKKG